MLKKKKQNVYFRFGLQVDTGKIIASYTVPRYETDGMTLSDYFDLEHSFFDGGQFDEAESLDLVLVYKTQSFPIDRLAFDIRGFKRIKRDASFSPCTKYFLSYHFFDVFAPYISKGLDCYFYLNDKKEVCYRYIDGELNYTNNGTSPYQIEGERVLYLTEYSTYFTVKEKRIKLTGGQLQVENLPDVYSSCVEGNIETRITNQVVSDGFFPVQSYNDSIISNSIALSHHNSIFSFFFDFSREVNDLYGNIITTGPTNPLLPLGTMFTMTDTHGTSVGYYDEPIDYIRFDSRIEGYPVPDEYNLSRDSFVTRQIFFGDQSITGNYSITEPIVFKSNDQDAYLIDGPERTILWKGGQEYLLPIEYFYEINGIKIPVSFQSQRLLNQYGDTNYPEIPFAKNAFFVDYFSAKSMLTHYWTKERYAIATIESPGFLKDHRDPRNFMVSSWFGDFIYKIRVDEFTDGSFFFDELIKSNYSINFIEQLTTNGKKIKRDLKIYHPSTQALWVEKYQIILKEEDNTAEIKYITRFQSQFTPPLEKEIQSDDIRDILVSLKQIMYVPD